MHCNIAKLLLKNNADITKSDYTGRTLREIVENNRDKKILKLYIVLVKMKLKKIILKHLL